MSRSARLCAAIAVAGALAPAQAADITRGAAVYQQHCAFCHGSNGVPNWPATPDLSRREGLMQTDQALLRSLREGRGAKPAYRGLLSDADILNVIAYSRTLAR